MEKSKLYLVFLVAGMSSRFGQQFPKQFAVIGPKNEIMMEVSLQQAMTIDFEEIIFVTNPLTRNLYVNFFGNEYNGKKIHYVDQSYNKQKRSRPWGTTGAICSLLPFVKEDAYFVILNGDDLYNASSFDLLITALKEKKTNYIGGISLYKTLSSTTSVNRGIIECDSSMKVVQIFEKQNVHSGLTEYLEKIANVNFLCFNGNTIVELSKKFEEFKNLHADNSTIECFITSVLDELIQEKKIELTMIPLVENVYGITFVEDVEIVKKKLKEERDSKK